MYILNWYRFIIYDFEFSDIIIYLLLLILKYNVLCILLLFMLLIFFITLFNHNFTSRTFEESGMILQI